jgi:superfamily II DNA/RNA helicase
MESISTSDRFDTIYRSIVVASVKRQLSQLFPIDELKEDDLAYALSEASRLALMVDGSDIGGATLAKKAYEVAVRTLEMDNGFGPAFREASEVILSRLGNFPALQLMGKRFQSDQSTFSALEILARKFENRFYAEGKSRVLTDFQVRLLKALEQNTRVSVSAPTSAGKSFTLELEIGRSLEKPGAYVVVYLVPTRALIRQVIYDLVRLVRGTDFQHIPILSVPYVPPEITAVSKVIYVLTQERFSNLLAIAPKNGFRLDALIVDEAQEISEEERGQTLETVISEALIRFPQAKVFFSAPLKSNPEYLLSLFEGKARVESFIEYMTPVSQNIINIYPISGRGNTEKAKFDIWLDDDFVNIGLTDLSFKFRQPYLHKIAIALTGPSESSIIYCNDAGTADKLALELARSLPEQDEVGSGISDLAAFLREHVHRKYRLADLLYKGVGFHYGNIPQIIRAKIEDLFREGTLKFVCCTSTLLQGMNLPAKNIFVENPKKGRGRPMSTGDFWNLVGRAGRMSIEFEGYVYCIHGKKWDSTPLGSPKLNPIKSAFASALNDRLQELTEVAVTPPVSSESDQLWAEQAVARIYAEFTRKGKRIADSRFANAANRAGLRALDEALDVWDKKQNLPESVFEHNLYFHPARFQELANRFRSTNALAWMPLNPYVSGSYDRLKSCFQILEEIFFKTGLGTYSYDAFLANWWMKGATLKEMIANKIERANAQNDDDRINSLIRKLFEEIEDRLRYMYVKYMNMYNDVLRAVLIEQNYTKEADRLQPIHLFLEYGASSVTMINLIAVGLSRTSAILLKQVRHMPDNLSVAECQSRIESIDISRAELPSICISEILRLRRGT